VKERSKYDHNAPLYFPNYIGKRLKHVFVTRLQFWRSRRFRQEASQAIWLNWSQLTHQQVNLDPVLIGLISYMFLTSEPLSEDELFDTLLQQCGTICRRQSRGYCAFTRNIWVSVKNIFIQSFIPLLIVLLIRFCNSTSPTTTYDAIRTVYYYYHYYYCTVGYYNLLIEYLKWNIH